MNSKYGLRKIAVGIVLLGMSGLFSACGGGGAATPAGGGGTTSYTVGGAVSGLSGTVVLKNNAGDDLSVAANGNFTFATSVANGNPYSVTVFTQPAGQTCSVSTGAGTVSGSNITNVAVICSANSYSVGGAVFGLTGSVVLQDNNGDDLTLAINETFTFATPVASGSPYSVTVLTQPTGQNCSVTNGTGTIAAVNVSNVFVTCAANTYTVGGNVSLLNGSMVLQNNASGNLSVSVNGAFNFPASVAYGNPYTVSVLTQPSNQNCAVANGTGTVTANVSNVAISCASQMGGAMLGNDLNLSPLVSTLAGATSSADGIGSAARFSTPYGVTSDSTNIFVADYYNNKIRKIVIATGAVSTLAGTGMWGAVDGIGTSASFKNPAGITTDGINLFVADTGNQKIRKIVIATGVVSSLTGVADTPSATGVFDGPAATATFNTPMGITNDGTNLYVADGYNNKIRKVVIATGYVSSFTGVTHTATTTGATDGASTAVKFNFPVGITKVGNTMFVADSGNNKIREVVITTGYVSSFTGAASTAGVTGAADGSAASATFYSPNGISSDGINLYVSDNNNNKIRQIVIASGVVSSLTGVANTAGVSGAADGAGIAATFSQPHGIVSVGGNLYVADWSNTIRTIVTSSAVVSTLAGRPSNADGIGTEASFVGLRGITTDGINLYVADTYNNKIRKIVIATGMVSTLAGTGVAGVADGPGATATFNNPNDITYTANNLYVTDNNKIRKIVIATGAVSSLTGYTNYVGAAGATDGAAVLATFSTPTGITTDGTNLYVTDRFNGKIRKIVIATGTVSSLTGTANVASTGGSTDGAANVAKFRSLGGITTDGTNLYVTDAEVNNKIRKVVISTGAVSSLTGIANTASALGSTDGASATATFTTLYGITTDGTNLYVTGSNKIRKIVISSGAVSSLTGVANTLGVIGATDGVGTAATFKSPYGITTDGIYLYVADQYNYTLRKIQ